MPTIDPAAGYKAVQSRLETTKNPRQRMILQTLTDHLKAEMDLSLEGLMATLVAEPKYHMWGTGRDTGPKGQAAVRQYYTDLVASRRGILEYAIERIVVDDDNVVTEGFIRAYQPGVAARAFGFDVPRTDATYLVTYRALLVWPFDAEGKLIGEDGYASWLPTDATPVPSDELPAAYVGLFDPSEYASVGIAPH